MKKILMMVAAAMMTANASAQNTVLTSNKGSDNWYFGINAGMASAPWITVTDGSRNDATRFSSLSANASLRFGRNFTTVFGLAAEGTFYGLSDQRSLLSTKTFIEATNVSLLGTFNLSNLLGGYPGEPRVFELTALGGFGWMHAYGTTPKTNFVTSKLAIDFTFNLGANKAWQLFLEPSITYALDGWTTMQVVSDPEYAYYSTYGAPTEVSQVVNSNNGMKYNLSNAVLGLNIGFNYKFLNSNGKHNFTKAQLRDQREIYDLNNKINDLRQSLDARDQMILEDHNRIEELEQALDSCNKRPMQTVVVKEEKKETFLQPIVIFGQGKSTIDPAQYASVEMIAKYMRNHPQSKVLVRGYASPEGNPELNQKLSVARAMSVMTALINRYKIAPNRITVEGMGATDSLSEEIDFNRVAMFIDITK